MREGRRYGDTRRATFVIAGSILLGYAAVKLALVLLGVVRFNMFGTDIRLYEPLAHSILAGKGFVISVLPVDYPTFLRLPGYPLFLAAMHGIFGDNDKIIQVAQVLLCSATIAIAFALARRYGRRAAFASLVIMILDPGFLINSLMCASETLAAFFLICGLAIWIHCMRKHSGFGGALAAGVVLGAAAITRPELFLVALVIVGLSFVRVPRLTAALIVGVLLISTPWFVRNHRLGYDGVSTTLGVNLSVLALRSGALDAQGLQGRLEPDLVLSEYLAMTSPEGARRLWEPLQDGRYVVSSGLSEVKINSLFVDAAISGFRAHPGALVSGVLKNLWRFVTNSFDRQLGIWQYAYAAASALIILLAVVGVSGGSASRSETRLFALCTLIPLLGIAVTTFVYYRYRIPFVPIIAVLAGIGFDRLMNYVELRLNVWNLPENPPLQ